MAPFYVVVYTDGDKEDFNAEELAHGTELALQIALEDDDTNDEDRDETSDVFSSDCEEESYRPPKVCLSFLVHFFFLILSIVVSLCFRKRPEPKKLHPNRISVQLQKMRWILIILHLTVPMLG